jgi:hypothetical protein
MIPKEDSRPKRYRWAPGGYYCECFHCKELFIGDKRATTCADCAYKDLPEPERQMRKQVYEWPTSELRWGLDGTLQQRWTIRWRDDDTRGAANPETSEWRKIPDETALSPGGKP